MIGIFLNHRIHMTIGVKMKKPVNKWNDADKRSFQDGVRMRAATIPNKKLAFNKSACRKFKHNKGDNQ